MKRALLGGGLASLLLFGQAVVGCVGEDPVAGGAGDAGIDGAAEAKANGSACGAGSECGSGICADGVCCESACTGTCESCKIPGSEGKCAPIPDGEDPESECPTTPLGDASADDAGADDASADDAGDPDAASDAGPPFVLPDAGVTANDDQCAGKCNGKRACAYAGVDRTCGSVVCGNTSLQGRASCDGKGHCLFGIEECKAFACTDGSPGCKSSCAGESDCLPNYFCEATTSTCKPKLANGSGCSSVVQCQTGFCADGVCCNDSCSGYLGAKCNVADRVGQCTCDACPGQTCKLYYRDEDGDGYGDMFGSVLNTRAKPGCEAGPAPVGFVANKTDCFDGPSPTAALVHPGQGTWYATPYTPPGGAATFDYDCSGQIDKEVPQVLGATCQLCSRLLSCSATTKCSATSTAGAVLGCRFNGKGCVGEPTGFTSDVACGATGTKTTCGKCSGGLLDPPTYTPGVQQKCH